MMPPQLKDPLLAYVAGKSAGNERLRTLAAQLRNAPKFTAQERFNAFMTGVNLGKEEQKASSTAGLFAVETPKGMKLTTGAGTTQSTIMDIRQEEIKQAILDKNKNINPFRLIGLPTYLGDVTIGPSVVRKKVTDLADPFLEEATVKKSLAPLVGAKSAVGKTVNPFSSADVTSQIAVTKLGPDSLTKTVGQAIQAGAIGDKDLTTLGPPPMPLFTRFAPADKVVKSADRLITDQYADAIAAETSDKTLVTDLRDALKKAEKQFSSTGKVDPQVQKDIIKLGQKEVDAAFALSKKAAVPFKFKPTYKQIGDYILTSVTGRNVEKYGVTVTTSGTVDVYP